MIHLAGDCAVPVVGQVVKNGKHMGFIMNKETPLQACELAKKSITKGMRRVVEELHGKGIIHGDIKLSNILLCSDGKVRLCDFAGAFLYQHSKEAPPVYTTTHLSPYRMAHMDGPFTMEDDLFALGVSIWELYTGKQPFHGERFMRRLIREGSVVELSEIGDDEVIHLAEELMSFISRRIQIGDTVSDM